MNGYAVLAQAIIAAWLLGACALAAAVAPSDGVEFNGTSTHAVVGKGEALDADAFTLAAWVKLRHTHGSQTFLSRGRAAELFTFYLHEKRVRMLVAHRPDAYTHANVPAPPRNVWTHYAGTYDGREIKLYVNGELKHTQPARGRIARSKAELYIGSLTPTERLLDGWIDDVRIWQRALAAGEVAALVGGKEAKGFADGLIARWTKQSLEEDTWENRADPDLPAAFYRTFQPTRLPITRDDGYRGVWYCCHRQDDQYVYKYSGGLGTYCAKHIPFACYAKKVNKTFFCYGGAPKTGQSLLHMVSYYDHATGTVPRPTVLLDKHTTDAHDNPTIMLDNDGYVWIFSSAHGTGRPSYVSRSTKPYSIEAFDRLLVTNFSYTQPWHLAGKGFLFLHTRYIGGRMLYQQTSPDGVAWSKPRLLSAIHRGHYQVSWRHGGKVGTAFNYHPQVTGANWRTNLYYMESTDFGRTWHNAQGETLGLPLKSPRNPALVHDFEAEKLNVYMKDLAFDAKGRPVILCLTSKGWQSGPANAPRIWRTARWTGERWEIRGTIESDNNYDMGSLYIERDDLWRIIGPTQPGPQRYNTGGEVAIWTSTDQGKTWAMLRQLTRNSPFNHTYCRKPVNAHPGFYALWADGHGLKPSQSSLYFCDKTGQHVWRLPRTIAGEFARPEPVR